MPRPRAPRRLLFPILVLAVALFAAACGDDDESTTATTGGAATTVPTFPAGSTMANIQSKGKIVVGVKYDAPGFGQRNPTNNQIEGFDVEIAKLMAVGIFGGTVESLGSKIELVEAIAATGSRSSRTGTSTSSCPPTPSATPASRLSTSPVPTTSPARTSW